jgi:hypothetical protein
MAIEPAGRGQHATRCSTQPLARAHERISIATASVAYYLSNDLVFARVDIGFTSRFWEHNVSEPNSPSNNQSSAPDPNSGSDAEKPDPAGQPEDSTGSGVSSSKLLTGGGLMAAFGFVILIIAVRGGKKLIRQAVDDPEPSPPVVTPAPRQHPEFGVWLQTQQKLKTIDSIQRQNKLTDKEMNDVLKTVWRSQNPDTGKRPPWQPVDSNEKSSAVVDDKTAVNDRTKEEPAAEVSEWRKLVN